MHDAGVHDAHLGSRKERGARAGHAGIVDNSRRLWTVLVFLVWHGIFVEGSIVPDIADPTYPVRL